MKILITERQLNLLKENGPFNEQEEEIMNLLIEAHNKFVEMERSHPSEMTDWIHHIHALQRLLGQRVLRRNYPDYFNK